MSTMPPTAIMGIMLSAWPFIMFCIALGSAHVTPCVTWRAHTAHWVGRRALRLALDENARVLAVEVQPPCMERLPSIDTGPHVPPREPSSG